MICLTTFILYNSLFAFSIIPTTKSKPIKSLYPTSPCQNESSKKFLKTEIFMHAFYKPKEEVDLNKYLPYINDLSKKYVNFKYNLIIVINDTHSSTVSSKELNAAEFNDMALNTLWSKDLTYHKIKKVKNVNLQYITLSDYMDNSSLIKFWRKLSNEVIEFLLRSLWIWDKGGIVFNPSILIPGTLKEAYTAKLFDVLQNYDNTYFSETTTFKPLLNNKIKTKVNNIRDIIDALEREDSNSAQVPLVEAENEEFNVKINKSRLIRSINHKEHVSTNKLETSDKDIILPQLTYVSEKNEILNSSLNLENTNIHKFNLSNSLSMLPSFLEYLFHGKNYAHHFEETPVLHLDVKTTDDVDKIKSNVLTTDIQNEVTYPDTTQKGEINDRNNLEGTINNIQEVAPAHFSHINKELLLMNNKNRLTIDLKGNIIATKTPCHAFLGSLYSNAVHYPKPVPLTNFLISELSMFCKGLLSTCLGIDLILL